MTPFNADYTHAFIPTDRSDKRMGLLALGAQCTFFGLSAASDIGRYDFIEQTSLRLDVEACTSPEEIVSLILQREMILRAEMNERIRELEEEIEEKDEFRYFFDDLISEIEPMLDDLGYCERERVVTITVDEEGRKIAEHEHYDESGYFEPVDTDDIKREFHRLARLYNLES